MSKLVDLQGCNEREGRDHHGVRERGTEDDEQDYRDQFDGLAGEGGAEGVLAGLGPKKLGRGNSKRAGNDRGYVLASVHPIPLCCRNGKQNDVPCLRVCEHMAVRKEGIGIHIAACQSEKALKSDQPQKGAERGCACSRCLVHGLAFCD